MVDRSATPPPAPGWREDRVGAPFHTWAQLEQTFQYATRYAPELFGKPYDRAQRAAARVEALDGKTINAGDGPKSAANLDNIQVSEKGGGGTSADYLTRRLVRDHPEIAARMRAGEFRSVRAAAVAAGIPEFELFPRPRFGRLRRRYPARRSAARPGRVVGSGPAGSPAQLTGPPPTTSWLTAERG